MSNTKKSQYGKKKTMRNILIGVIAVLVIAIAVLLIVLTQKDAAGMNCFQRNATAASADGVKVNMSEYRLTYDTLLQNYQTQTFTDDQVRLLQENAAKQALLQKIYAKEAKALGLSLTEEQEAEAEKTAQTQIDSIRQYFTSSLAQNGNYSKTTLDSQLSNYFQQLGMTEKTYFAFLKESVEADYYSEAISAYYQEHVDAIDENDLIDYYRTTTEGYMYTEDEDGTKKPTYEEGQYWYYIMMYMYGYGSPMRYVPEGFIYIDYIRIEKDNKLEVQEIIDQVNAGEIDFDQLKKSDDNTDIYRNVLTGSYPIGTHDYTQIFTKEEAYEAAAALAIGEIGSYIDEPVTAEDGTSKVTGYLFRRAKGDMCMDGETGIIKIDYYPNVRSSVINQYRSEKWFSDMKFEDRIYSYKGAAQ